MGGLGNQLFQVATVTATAWDIGAECSFPRIERTPSRIGTRSTYWNSVFWKVKTRPVDYYLSFVLQPHAFTYHVPIHLQPCSQILLQGHFEAPEYFDHHRPQILDLFELPCAYANHVDNRFARLIKGIKGPFVSLHIRRDDFVTAPNPNDLCLWKDEFQHYFLKAAEFVPSDAVFIVFSDDTEWSRAFIHRLFPERIALFPKDKDFIELFMMSKCDHHIIANSTFSWWGAYLNKKPHKIVVAPKQWTIIPDKRTLLLPDWKTVDLFEK